MFWSRPASRASSSGTPSTLTPRSWSGTRWSGTRWSSWLAAPLSERWAKAIPRYLSSLPGDEFPHIAGSIDILREQAFFLRSSGDVAFDGGFRMGLEALLTGLATVKEGDGKSDMDEVRTESAGHPRGTT